MRISEIKYQLDMALEKLTLDYDTSGNNYYINNHLEIIGSVKKLVDLGLFAAEFESIRNLKPLYTAITSPIAVDPGTLNAFSTIIYDIKSKCTFLNSIYAIVKPAISNETISIKLPDTSDFNSLVDDMRAIQSALDSIAYFGNGELKVSGFDSGSMWVDVLVKNPETLAYLALAINASIKLADFIFEKRKEIESIKGYAIENQVQTVVLDAITASVDSYKEQLSLELIKSKTNSELPTNEEDVSRMVLNITRLAEVNLKGAQFRAAINAPENVAKSFPNYSNIGTPERIELLTSDEQSN